MDKPPAHDPPAANEPMASLLEAFLSYLTQTTGLFFGIGRQAELRRALRAITRDMGFSTPTQCITALIHEPTTPERLAILAKHLTVPETYFMRDTSCLQTLAAQVLPKLIQEKRQSTRKLRAWSVACCTGEEAYSIAITLARAIPDWQQWDISILATDINPICLAKAKQATYGEWSFRNAPEWLKTDYMLPVVQSAPGAPVLWQVKPEIRALVRFEPLNLADETYPGFTWNMDLIFCANVLMYFSDAQAQAVVGKLANAQTSAGWLIIGPNDIPSKLPSSYKPVVLEKATLFRKLPFEETPAFAPLPAPRATPAPVPPAALPTVTLPPLPKLAPAPLTPVPAPMPTMDAGENARSLADQGKLKEALKACDLWVSRDKSNPAGHYLRAVVLMEMGNASQAAVDLRKALYLNAEFVMAHFTAGSLALSQGNSPLARKHMANVVRLLAHEPPGDIVPESAGMTVQRVLQLASEFLTPEASR